MHYTITNIRTYVYSMTRVRNTLTYTTYIYTPLRLGISYYYRTLLCTITSTVLSITYTQSLWSRASEWWRHCNCGAAKRRDSVAMVSKHGGRRPEVVVNAGKSNGMASIVWAGVNVRCRIGVNVRGGVGVTVVVGVVSCSLVRGVGAI